MFMSMLRQQVDVELKNLSVCSRNFNFSNNLTDFGRMPKKNAFLFFMQQRIYVFEKAHSKKRRFPKEEQTSDVTALMLSFSSLVVDK